MSRPQQQATSCDSNPLMKTGEVARLFNVDPRTVYNWARQGKLCAHRTLGGQHRFPRDVVHALFEGQMDNRVPAQRKPTED